MFSPRSSTDLADSTSFSPFIFRRMFTKPYELKFFNISYYFGLITSFYDSFSRSRAIAYLVVISKSSNNKRGPGMELCGARIVIRNHELKTDFSFVFSCQFENFFLALHI